MARNNIYTVIFLILLFWLSSFSLQAQSIKDSGHRLYNNYLLDKGDLDKTDGQYVTNKTDSTKWQKPTVAFFKSMVIPGWGQLSNRQYKKAVIFIAAEASLIGTLIHYLEKTSDAKKAFDIASAGTDDALIAETFENFDKAKDRRNLFSWLTGAFVFYSMFDAYVDAHLARFPKYSKNISLQINSEGTEKIEAILAFEF